MSHTASPCFFLPGWALGRGPLRPWAETLAGRGRTLSLLDLPGYGEAPAAADFASACAELAARLPAGAVLGGWSLGALLALGTALQAPEKFSRLILVAATPCFRQRPDWSPALSDADLAGFASAIAADPAGSLTRFVGNFNRGEARARAATRQLLASADPLPAPAVLQQGLDWLAAVDLRPQLSGLRLPTLLLHGELDPLMPLAAGRWLADHLPGARLAVLDGAAHAPFVSQTDAFLACLEGFLDEPAT